MSHVNTLWPIEPHTAAKHAILRAYLAAWFPILGAHHDRIVYYDGFAGPGRYEGGEDGSPIIALKVATEHRSAPSGTIHFYFVEERPDRAEQLGKEVEAVHAAAKFRTTVTCGDFESELGRALDAIDDGGLRDAPTFAFIDPFGIKNIPFELIKRLLVRPRCETLITFMNVALQRFPEELADHVDRLFGKAASHALLCAETDAAARVAKARILYASSLGDVAKFVRYFAMRDRADRPIYDLFFASNHPLGHSKMKESMWKVDESGDFRFSDGVDPKQAVLFSNDPGKGLAPVLLRQFAGRTMDVGEVFGFVNDKTAYLEKHARAALKVLETPDSKFPRIAVANLKRDGLKRKGGTFPSGAIVTFPKMES
jgi:three-Cys-motif partner protein